MTEDNAQTQLAVDSANGKEELLKYLNCAAVGVEISELRKSFGDNEVLRGVNLSIEPGETTVILGKSGTGKSVLLRHIIGLEKPDSGHIFIDGVDIHDPQFKKKFRVAMVFQSSALFNSLTVGENVALYLREHHVFGDEGELRNIVKSALSIVGLHGVEDDMPSTLSGGMRRRVATARALVMNPDLILFDEPTSGLDPLMTRTVGDLILSLKHQVSITQIVVTHDIDLAFYVADRVSLLRNGVIVETGTPAQFQESSNPYVNEFTTPQFE